MATYKEIQSSVEQHDGFVPKTCWIADVKEAEGLQVRRAWNRETLTRKHPCPPNKRDAIKRAIRRLR